MVSSGEGAPGFFLPGDEFFFNPNLGYKNREGSFLQTTTYLIGRKPKQDTPFGFLQLNESGDAGYNLELNGLFLRKIPVSTPIPDKGQTKAKSTRLLQSLISYRRAASLLQRKAIAS